MHFPLANAGQHKATFRYTAEMDVPQIATQDTTDTLPCALLSKSIYSTIDGFVSVRGGLLNQSAQFGTTRTLAVMMKS
jgi:hypothetical protein